MLTRLRGGVSPSSLSFSGSELAPRWIRSESLLPSDGGFEAGEQPALFPPFIHRFVVLFMSFPTNTF